MNNKDILAKNLKYLSNKKNINLTEFEKIMIYPETAVFNQMHGKSYPKIDKIQEMSDFFNIFKSDLTEDKNDSINPSEIQGIKIIKNFANIPIISKIACSKPVFFQQNYEGFL